MGTTVHEDTFALLPRGSFVQGFGTLFDIAGAMNYYYASETPELADRKAMAADWHAVGEDLRNAIAEYRALVNEPQKEQTIAAE